MSSLTEGLNFDKGSKQSAKHAPAQKGNGTNPEKVKLIIAISCLAVATVVMLIYFDVISLSSPPKEDPVKVQENLKAVEVQKKELEKEQKRIESLPPSQRPVTAGGN